ncbi:hypothetical protein [Streptomyces sp. NPDC053048]|uniref:hypothetical protein n=1 Tax=Streptomyces sp. NPDC053048 TaxID=3365694 RepID=UPI0037D51C0F
MTVTQRPRIAAVLSAVGVLLLGVLATTTGQRAGAAAAAPAPARSLARTALTCALQTAPGRPITFRPSVTGRLRQVSATGTVLLDRCTSPDGSQRGVRSGRLVLHGAGMANCLTADRLEGSGTITWYHGWDRRGYKAGTTRFTPAGRGSGYTPADAFLSGNAVAGRMAHRHVHGRAVPTADVTGCAARGLRAVAGRGNISFG